MARLAATLIAAAIALPATGQERYEGYYYPPVTSEEAFTRELRDAPKADRQVRIGFTTTITKAQLAAPEAPRFVIFAKGDDARHLIAVALDSEVFETIYRARAVMAQLTSNLRGTEFFIEQDLHSEGTFYDMLTILDFETLTISDGESWSHLVTFG